MSLYSPHNWGFVKHGWKDIEIYRKFCKYLVTSIYKYHPNCIVYFTSINFTENDCNDLLKMNPNIVFNKIEEDFTKQSQEWYKGFIMYNRTFGIRKALKVYKKPVLSLDTDCMLRGSVQPVFNKLKNGFDISLLLRPKEPERTRVNAGVVGFANTPKSLKLVDDWITCMGKDFDKICMKNKQGKNTAGDQKCLWECYNKSKSDVKLFKLPIKYNNGILEEDAIIWHGHSGDKIKALENFTKDYKRKYKE